jgi:hypothetical protein
MEATVLRLPQPLVIKLNHPVEDEAGKLVSELRMRVRAKAIDLEQAADGRSPAQQQRFLIAELCGVSRDVIGQLDEEDYIALADALGKERERQQIGAK